jgi:hypothetical protein
MFAHVISEQVLHCLNCNYSLGKLGFRKGLSTCNAVYELNPEVLLFSHCNAGVAGILHLTKASG